MITVIINNNNNYSNNNKVIQPRSQGLYPAQAREKALGTRLKVIKTKGRGGREKTLKHSEN